MNAGDKTGRTILALDGGGVRGVISIAFLERIEALFAEHAGAPVRLADRFDLVGGTSTGAIIATALALGLSASELKAMYFELAPRVFRRSLLRLAFIQTRFDATALRQEIEAVVGDRTLDTPDLRTALAIIAKRLDTGGAWVVSNNPQTKYWESHPDGRYLGNRHFRLADLVRASTAAPYYFEPQEIAIAYPGP
jgi:patatin-like phospholipase/acyl hydrolase